MGGSPARSGEDLICVPGTLTISQPLPHQGSQGSQQPPMTPRIGKGHLYPGPSSASVSPVALTQDPAKQNLSPDPQETLCFCSDQSTLAAMLLCVWAHLMVIPTPQPLPDSQLLQQGIRHCT